MTLRHPFMIKSGDFFFRYRSLLFPAIYLALLSFVRPVVILNPAVYEATIWAGLAITLLGEALRIFTIGFDYIDRGGRGGKVHASRLVTGGMYNHVRNPMYVGNLMIAVGIGLYSGAPVLLVTALPFFIFAYLAIMAAEENFLRGEFGAEYEDFCKRVNRLFPSFKNMRATFSGFKFNWIRPLEKDSGTAFYTLVALALIPWWRLHFLYGPEAASPYVPYALGIVAVLTPIYIVLRILKKQGRLAG